MKLKNQTFGDEILWFNGTIKMISAMPSFCVSLPNPRCIQAIIFYFYVVLRILSSLRPEFFNFSFYRPDRPEFSKIEKKIKVLFFNFIFRDRSESPFCSSLHKFYQYQFSLCWFPSCRYWLFLKGRSQGIVANRSTLARTELSPFARCTLGLSRHFY